MSSKPSESAPMLKIGHDPGTLEQLRATLMEILHVASCGDGPKVAAIKALGKLGSIKHVSITGCTFTSGRPRK